MKLKGNFFAALFSTIVVLLTHNTSWADRAKHTQQMPRSMAFPRNAFSPVAFCADMGTTPYLKEIFTGRCLDYQFAINRASCDVSNLKNCTALWELFQQAFVYRDPCNVTGDLYEPFSKAATQAVEENKTLFWSGTYYLAHTYAAESRQYTTLEDSLPGFMSEMLIWCGQVEVPGINYHNCLGPCYEKSQDTFWGTLSADFARQARGVAAVMLNGSREGGAFRNNSYFAKYEVPNLDPRKVTSLTILVIHTLDVPKIESCGEGSILRLQNLLLEHGFKHECIDDPDAVRHILCAEKPESHDCKIWNLSTCPVV